MGTSSAVTLRSFSGLLLVWFVTYASRAANDGPAAASALLLAANAEPGPNNVRCSSSLNSRTGASTGRVRRGYRSLTGFCPHAHEGHPRPEHAISQLEHSMCPLAHRPTAPSYSYTFCMQKLHLHTASCPGPGFCSTPARISSASMIAAYGPVTRTSIASRPSTSAQNTSP